MYWVEKSSPKGSPLRHNLRFEVGHVLISPTKSKSGVDVHRFMHEVNVDDIVLHITDNEGITGYSRAASRAELLHLDGLTGIELSLSDSSR